MKDPIRYALRVVLACAFLLFPALGQAKGNPLSTQESGARRLAITILDDLKPIESWVVKATGASSGQVECKELVEVTGSGVNMRVEPSVGSRALAVSQIGEVFEYLLTDGDWYLVRIDETRQAYISARFSRLTTAATWNKPQSQAPERIDPRFEVRAREILEANRAAVAGLTRLAQSAETEYRRRYSDLPPHAGDSEHQAAAKSIRRIRKYGRVVSERLDRYTRMVTGVDKPVSRSGSSHWWQMLRGTVRAGFGTNTAENVSGGNTVETDVTRSEIEADLTANLSPDDELALNVSRVEEIRFAPSSRTRAALDYTRRLGDKAQVGSRVGLHKYRNHDNDSTDIDRTEFGLRGRIAPSRQFRAKANLDLVGASYPKNGVLDYQDTRVGLGAGGEVSPTVTWGAGFTHTTHDIDDNTNAEDNTYSRIAGNLDIRTGERSTVALVAQSEGYKFDNDNHPGNYTKRGVKLQMRSRGAPGESNTMTFEFRTKDHDDTQDRNYREIRGELRSHQRTDDGRERNSTLTANYRNFKGNGNARYLDYIESRFDLRRSRAGTFLESNNYGQYFFKSKNVERNPRLSQFFWLGLILGHDRVVEVGPHVALNTVLVTINGAKDAQGDDLGVFEDPSNSVRYGVKGSVRVTARPLSVRGKARFEKTHYYNVDGAASLTRVELEGDATYGISNQIDALVHMKYYTTKSDGPASTKASELDILFGLIYKIGAPR